MFAPPAPAEVPLDPHHSVRVLALPPELLPDPPAFEALWGLHPAEFNSIHMAGRPVQLPRWQQAYGEDYRFSGNVSKALPVPPLLAPTLAWARAALDARLSGLLVNWYDAERGHHIGKHRDSPIGLVPGAPIVTISLGATRLFRLRPYGREGERKDDEGRGAPRGPAAARGRGAEDAGAGARRGPPARVASIDVPVDHGAVLVMPWVVNQRFTHEVPHRPSKDSGRRISVTIRAFAAPRQAPNGTRSAK